MLLLIVFTYVVWGGSFVSTKVALTAVAPFWLGAVRMAFTTLTFLVWGLAHPGTIRPREKELFLLLFNGFLAVLIMGFFNIGVQYTTASRSAIFMNTNPFFIAFFAHFFLVGDRLNWQKLIGLVLAFSGVAAVFAGKEDLAGGSLAGDLMVMLSAIVLASQFIVMKKMLVAQDPARLMFWMGSTSLALFAGTGALIEPFPVQISSLWVVVSLLYLGLVISGFCFFVQISLLKRFSPNLVGSFSFIMPVSGVTSSLLLLKEPLTWGLMVGAVLVAIGIFVVNYRAKFSTGPVAG